MKAKLYTPPPRTPKEVVRLELSKDEAKVLHTLVLTVGNRWNVNDSYGDKAEAVATLLKSLECALEQCCIRYHSPISDIFERGDSEGTLLIRKWTKLL